MRQLILLTSQTCSLCDKAKDIVLQYRTFLSLEEFEILTNDDLFERYRYSIPVLKDKITDSELHWPFTYEGFGEWLLSLEGKDVTS